MANNNTKGDAVNALPTTSADIWSLLRIPHFKHDHPPVRNANEVHAEQLSPLEVLATKMTDKVGSMGFFFIILGWTVIWTGYNISATELKFLHWRSFDPFPAFVAYLLISNVIQILLMPLIMVGQNVQARHTEIRAELDFEINQKAEKEIMTVLHHLEHNTKLLLHEIHIAEADVLRYCGSVFRGVIFSRILAIYPVIHPSLSE